MSELLSDERQMMIVDTHTHYASIAGQEAINLEIEKQEFLLMSMLNPKVSIDGNQWCVLYGENLQDGVAGFGDSPLLAMFDFNKAWHKKLEAK